MSWAFIGLLLILLLAGLFLLGRLPRVLWGLVGAALLIGLAGYAWQGEPGLRGEPRHAGAARPRFDEDLAKLRNSFGGTYGEAGQWLTLSDGLARQGKTKEAVNVLAAALRSAPRDAALWVGMGNALLSHGDGMLSPAAEYSYRQAMTVAPEASAGPFFYGLALASSGQFARARTLWADLLARVPEKAPLHAQLQADLQRLDQIIAQQASRAGP
ncbi:MAG: tetratricopeptide repeat protein [Sphingobium sp.]